MKFIIPTKEIEEILNKLDRIENLIITTGAFCINKVYDKSNPDIISYMLFARFRTILPLDQKELGSVNFKTCYTVFL